MRVAKVEFVRGFVSTILLTTVLGLWGVLLSFFTGILWATGGSWKKIFRRLGVPLAVILFAQFWSLWDIYIVIVGITILSRGDGYPDFTDPGSWLGQQVKRLGLSDEVGGEITKWVIVILLQLAWIPIFWR